MTSAFVQILLRRNSHTLTSSVKSDNVDKGESEWKAISMILLILNWVTKDKGMHILYSIN